MKIIKYTIPFIIITITIYILLSQLVINDISEYIKYSVILGLFLTAIFFYFLNSRKLNYTFSDNAMYDLNIDKIVSNKNEITDDIVSDDKMYLKSELYKVIKKLEDDGYIKLNSKRNKAIIKNENVSQLNEEEKYIYSIIKKEKNFDETIFEKLYKNAKTNI